MGRDISRHINHETGQYKTDILLGLASKGLMQIIQTRDRTVQDRYSQETGQYKTDILAGWDRKG